MKKTLLIGVAFIAAALAGIALWQFTPLDSAIKAAIEKQGAEITRVSLTLDHVRLSPAADEGLIDGLNIANPAGFRAPQAVSGGSIDIAFDRYSLARDVLLIHRIAIEGPRIFYEAGSDGRSNFDVIRTGMAQRPGMKPVQDGEPAGKLVVEHLTIRGARLAYSPYPPEAGGFEAGLPDIEMRELGKAGGGITPAELAVTVTDMLMSQMARSIAGAAQGAAGSDRGPPGK